MTTVINNPRPDVVERTTTINKTTDSGAGWAIAIIVLLAVIIGGFFWYRHHAGYAAAPAGQTNINVSLPSSPTTNPGTGY